MGLGCMRFPRKGGRIDQEKTVELVDAAIGSGINYFDTAYVYQGSEEALGKALSCVGKREQVLIATKLPHYMCRKPGDFDRMFNTQLERLSTQWVDYYLMHMLGNAESWERLKPLGIERWIDEKRSEGKIRNIGFSFHGGREGFLRLLDAYDWDCCMVQYNYFDENDQAGAAGVLAAHKKGMPVFVMEPLRGGMLAGGLPKAATEALYSADKARSPAEWALNWVYDQTEVTMALSGMSNMEQLTQNVQIASRAMPGMIPDSERPAYKEAVAALKKSVKVPCSACGYCLPCPSGVDIPSCFACYNASYSAGRVRGIMQYMQITGQMMPVQSDASKCVACGKCERHCPQGIQIPDELTKVKRRMMTLITKPLFALVRRHWRVKRQPGE